MFSAFAACIALGFGWIHLKKRSRLSLSLLLVWLAYAAYEWMMEMRVLCTGECNIRVDLLLFWPMLFIFSAFGVFRLRRR